MYTKYRWWGAVVGNNLRRISAPKPSDGVRRQRSHQHDDLHLGGRCPQCQMVQGDSFYLLYIIHINLLPLQKIARNVMPTFGKGTSLLKTPVTFKTSLGVLFFFQLWIYNLYYLLIYIAGSIWCLDMSEMLAAVYILYCIKLGNLCCLSLLQYNKNKDHFFI